MEPLVIRGKLSTWKLRSRIARRYKLWPVTAWKSFGHWRRTLGYILGRHIPNPNEYSYYVFLLFILLFFVDIFIAPRHHCAILRYPLFHLLSSLIYLPVLRYARCAVFLGMLN